jgi:hypothetical protein
MSLADSQSDLLPDTSANGGPLGVAPVAAGAKPAAPRIWLNGDVLACACPECGSPMSIRLWLMVADCWRCGASLELNEELEREARALLAQRDAAQAASQPPQAVIASPPHRPAPPPGAPPAIRKPAPSAPATPPPAPQAQPASPPQPTEPQESVPSPPPRPKRQLAAFKPGRVRQQLEQIRGLGEVRLWFRETFRHLPAWVASAIFHMAVMILLASLWFLEPPEEERPLILSTRISELDREGAFEDPAEMDPIQFEDAGAPEPTDELKSETPGPTDEFADRPVVPGEVIGDLPDDVRRTQGPLATGRGRAVLTGRSPEARARLAQQEGGTIQSEAAVARGLEWLARHQNPNGSWSLNTFHRVRECRGRCGNPGHVHSDTAATAMALLPFLGAGHTHTHGDYRDSVRKGLDWLVREQRPSGDLRGEGNGQMYAHGQAAIVLCEAFAMTRDEELRVPAQMSLDFIVKAQHPAGGWRYYPGQPGDTSLVGWQLMALRSGQMGYLLVPQETLDLAGEFLDSTQTDDSGGRYSYQPGGNTSHVMSAEALLCRQYAGWGPYHPGLAEGCRWLLAEHPPRRQRADIYYWYYATQVMHHVGGETWERWNSQLRDLLVEMQETKGHQAGSWDPAGPFSDRGGRLYMTALAVCTLEVYYRHLPLYRTID